MSFFGITALGPPNVFQTSLINALGNLSFAINLTGLTAFSEEEFKRSFDKVDRDNSGYITSNEVEDLLFETYGFPPLEEEVKSNKTSDYISSVHGRVRHQS
jgi:Ca2+-binding EF-hand superfamily protein